MGPRGRAFCGGATSQAAPGFLFELSRAKLESGSVRPQLNTNWSLDDAHTVEVDLSQLEVSVLPRMMLDDVRAEVRHTQMFVLLVFRLPY